LSPKAILCKKIDGGENKLMVHYAQEDVRKVLKESKRELSWFCAAIICSIIIYRKITFG
jgi:hypothetical protein